MMLKSENKSVRTQQRFQAPTTPKSNHYQLIVIGAGSGGFGAALSAARLGIKVLLVEKSPYLGGNAMHGGVNVWEPGVGGTGIPFDLYKRLKCHPHAVGIYSFGRHMAWELPGTIPRFPGGELVIDPSKHYIDSLQRYGAPQDFSEEAYRRKHWHGVPFAPDAYASTMTEMLKETGNCTVILNTAFEEACIQNGQILSLLLANSEWVSGDYFVDATANLLLARKAGCTTSLGQEAKSLYNEPGAPETPTDQLNGASLVYRVRPVGDPYIEPLPPDIPAYCWWQNNFPAAAFSQCPSGEYSINSLPTMDGREVLELGHRTAYRECRRRVKAHWHHVQVSYPEFQHYRMSQIAPSLGVREGPRLIGQYVLTEHDIDQGIGGQYHEDIITIADHAKDTHSIESGRCGAHELQGPYGVPFRCLLARGISNLMVACRGASFSSVAASSCRLSRTMMQLGQAAGTAATIAAEKNIKNLAEIPSSALRQSLEQQHVELTWPRSESMIRYLKNESMVEDILPSI